MDESHSLKGRKQSAEHIAKRARKCEPGCTCKRHTSQKTDEVRAKHRKNTKEKWEAGLWDDRAEKTAATRAAWTDEQKAELSEKMSEAKRQEWARAKAEGRRRNRHYGTRKRTSKHELALVPYMDALGYKHDTGKYIGHRIPDFVNEPAKQLYEYFGSYWHPDRDEERRVKEFYALRGWTCYVLWEDDLYDWLQARAHLVTDEQHELAWKAAKVNNGFKKAPNLHE